MKSSARFLPFLLVGLLVLTSCSRRADLPWGNDLGVAKARAAREGKNLLVDFTGSTWCGPCRSLKKEVFSSSKFAAFTGNVVLVALDYPPQNERQPEHIAADPGLAALMVLKNDYAVASFPTVILFTPDHQEIARVVGYGGQSPSAYLARLTGAVPQPPM